MFKSRRNLLLSAVGLVFGIVLVGVLWLALRDSSTSAGSGADESTKPAVGAPLFDNQRAEQINADITSGVETRVRSAIELPVDQPISGDAAQQLASLAPIRFDLGSVQYLDASTATALAHSGPADSTAWTVYLVLDQQVWKISTAVRQ